MRSNRLYRIFNYILNHVCIELKHIIHVWTNVDGLINSNGTWKPKLNIHWFIETVSFKSLDDTNIAEYNNLN